MPNWLSRQRATPATLSDVLSGAAPESADEADAVVRARLFVSSPSRCSISLGSRAPSPGLATPGLYRSTHRHCHWRCGAASLRPLWFPWACHFSAWFVPCLSQMKAYVSSTSRASVSCGGGPSQGSAWTRLCRRCGYTPRAATLPLSLACSRQMIGVERSRLCDRTSSRCKVTSPGSLRRRHSCGVSSPPSPRCSSRERSSSGCIPEPSRSGLHLGSDVVGPAAILTNDSAPPILPVASLSG